MQSDVWLVGIGALLTLGLMKMLMPWARRLNWVDKPEGYRKIHAGDVPLVGGVAMYIAFATTLLATQGAPVRPLVTLAGLACLIGLWDDWHNQPAWQRCLLQAFVLAIAFFLLPLRLTFLGDLLGQGPIMLSTAALPMTCFAGIGLLNALNMLDGSDGLLALLVLLQQLVFFFLSPAADQHVFAVSSGVLLGFLYCNYPGQIQTKRSFMGDAGSMFLGFLSLWSSLFLTQPPTGTLEPLVMLWVMAVPLWDIGAVMSIRAFQGRGLMVPGLDHLHHRLLRAHYTPLQVLGITAGLALLTISIGLMWQRYALPVCWGFISFLIGALLYGVQAFRDENHHPASTTPAQDFRHDNACNS